MQIIVFLRFEDPRRESARVCKYAYGIVCARNVYELFSVLSVVLVFSPPPPLSPSSFSSTSSSSLPSLLFSSTDRSGISCTLQDPRDATVYSLPPPSIIPPLLPPSAVVAKALSNLLIFFASPMGSHIHILTPFSHPSILGVRARWFLRRAVLAVRMRRRDENYPVVAWQIMPADEDGSG